MSDTEAFSTIFVGILIAVALVFSLVLMVLYLDKNTTNNSQNSIKDKNDETTHSKTWLFKPILCFVFGIVSLVIATTLKSKENPFFVISFFLIGMSGYSFINNPDKIKEREDEQKRLRENALLQAHQIIDKHFDVLYTKFNQLRYQDDYGYWHNEDWFKELDYFFENVFLNELSEEDRYSLNDYKTVFNDYFYPKLSQGFLNEYIYKATKKEIKTGEDFEDYIKNILYLYGFNVQKTPKTGDQGVDLIVKTDTDKIAIQCKFYSKPVGNKAVQEVAAGKVFYQCTKALVVSNQSYTLSAKKLAQNLDVKLLNEKTLASYFNIENKNLNPTSNTQAEKTNPSEDEIL